MQNIFWDKPPQIFQNYVGDIWPTFHSIYELKEKMEGVKLRWAIPWTFAQTWNWSQILCSPGWCYTRYLIIWIPLPVPAVEAVSVCVALFPLCGPSGLTEIFLCSLGSELGGRGGCKLMAVSRVLPANIVKKQGIITARGPMEFMLKVQQENKLSSCTPELCCQFGKL